MAGNTVRVRLTLAAVLIVGVALIAGGVGLVWALDRTLTSEVRAAAGLRATEVAAAIDQGRTPADLTLGAPAEDEQLTQIVNDAGRVVASSPNMTGKPAVARRSGRVTTPIDDDRFVAVAVPTRDGRLTVIVARALNDVSESTRIVTRLLIIGLPVLLALVALTTWRTARRALAPVEAIRREVDEISAAALHRRVPEPPRADEIGRLAATMNRMLGRLEQAQAGQRRFISDASHELRSPIASIRQHAEVALAHPERVPMAELADNVLAEGLRVQWLVDDLLLLARADEHTLQLTARPLDLDDLVFEETRRLRTTTTLRVDSTGVSAARVPGDAMGLRRVLRNLADNAARHARGRVTFGLVHENGQVLLTVEDDGPGIAAADRERVLGRFVRLDDARTRDHGGSGLGLAIVNELVTAHGGTFALAAGALGGVRAEITFRHVQPPLSGPGSA